MTTSNLMINFRDLFDVSNNGTDAKGSKETKYTDEDKNKDKDSSCDKMFRKKSSVVKHHKPWVEKYRPNKLDDVVYQDEVVQMLQDTLKTGNLPHMLLHGQPGVGKTSTVLAIAMQLFGPKIYNDRVIELNASDERGINVVRNKIVGFAKRAIGSKDPRYPCPPYKIIILDEADSMTTEAQSALRKTMEDYAHITRFCFICNYINQIIDPITSRCVKFRFKPLPDEHLINRLRYISNEEGMVLEDDAYNQISNVSDGDLRKAIMLLQNMRYIHKIENKEDNTTKQRVITNDDVCKTANCVTDTELAQIKSVCLDSVDKEVVSIISLVNQIKNHSYPVFNILKSVHQMIITSDKLTDRQKAIICQQFARTEKRLIDCADEYLQLLAVFMCIKSVVLNVDKSIYYQNI